MNELQRDRGKIFSVAVAYEGSMIDVGKIIAAHGIKGEVKVISLSSNPHRFDKGSKMTLAANGQEVTVVSCRPHKEALIIDFAEIGDRNAAEAVQGSLLQVPPDAAGDLPEGEYYIFQLEGLAVITAEGKTLGILQEVINTGANDVYRVAMGNGDYLLLPAVKQVVQKVDLAAGKITVALLPGLLEACKYHEN